MDTLTSLMTNGFVGTATSAYVDSDDGVLYVQGYNVQENGFNFHGIKRVSKAFHARNQKSCLRPGDLLTIQTGDIGVTTVVPPALAGANCHALVISRMDCRVSEPHFYCQYFNSQPGRARLREIETGSTMKHLNVGDMKLLLLPSPPVEEQRAIAAALSDMDALLAGLDRLIAKKRDLKQAAMQQLLSGQTRLPGFKSEWEVKRLGELGTTYGGLTGKSKTDFGTGAARYVTFMNVMTNTVIDHSTFEAVCVSPSENQNRVERGDLLFNGSSETPEEVALCALVQHDVRHLFLNSFCFGFRPRMDAEADGLFLTYYIRSAEGREIMKSLAQGSTRYNLSKKALLAAEVRVPSLPEQLAIAGALSDMDAELIALEARRDKTRALKQAMMQELLTGKTRLV
ncbi:MAG: restriction endonuclease subunit S [Betaproteobacteria bacterium]|nr:restriction endonuclease subunit S [Betaproteobacteria bacterium]